MTKISGGKKILTLVVLTFPFITCCASDSEKKAAAGKDASMLHWACGVGGFACLADLFMGVIPDIVGLEDGPFVALKVVEAVLGVGLLYRGFFYEDGLKEAQKKQNKEKGKQKKQKKKLEPKKLFKKVQSTVVKQKPDVPVKAKQEKKKTSGDQLKKEKPEKKKRLRDKFKDWLSRRKEPVRPMP